MGGKMANNQEDSLQLRQQKSSKADPSRRDMLSHINSSLKNSHKTLRRAATLKPQNTITEEVQLEKIAEEHENEDFKTSEFSSSGSSSFSSHEEEPHISSMAQIKKMNL